jgi:uncharacterized protein (DUF39 family)
VPVKGLKNFPNSPNMLKGDFQTFKLAFVGIRLAKGMGPSHFLTHGIMTHVKPQRACSFIAC